MPPQLTSAAFTELADAKQTHATVKEAKDSWNARLPLMLNLGPFSSAESMLGSCVPELEVEAIRNRR
jgi:hypothetical protein